MGCRCNRGKFLMYCAPLHWDKEGVRLLWYSEYFGMQRKQDVTCFAGLCNKNNSFPDRFVQVCLVYKIRTFIFHFYWNNSLTCWLCYIFPLVLASRCLLILWFWNDCPSGGNHTLIMLQTNFNCSKSSGPLAPVACELPPSPFYLGANTFFFYFRSLHFNATRAHVRSSPRFTQNSTEGERRNKSNPHP